MNGKNHAKKQLADAISERRVYAAVVSSLQENGMSTTAGIAALLHVSAALAEEVAGSETSHMRIIQQAMVDELARTFNRAIIQSGNPLSPMSLWGRIKFAVKLRFGLRWGV